jgi:hypothetical protein
VLTGLEQYAWERAGYFIRRALLPAATVERLLAMSRATIDDDLRSTLLPALLAEPSVAPLLVDLMGPSIGLASARLLERPREHRFGRATRVRLDAPAIEQQMRLAGDALSLTLSVALAPSEWLYVLPGTHTQAPTAEQAEKLLAGEADVPGQVRIRLMPGDALLRDRRIAHRCADPSGLWIQCGFADTLRRPYRSLPPVADDSSLPEPVRAAFAQAGARLRAGAGTN